MKSEKPSSGLKSKSSLASMKNTICLFCKLLKKNYNIFLIFFQKKKDEEEADPSTNNAVNLPMKNEPTTTGDPEKDKKIRKVNDKLTQIAKLKEQVKSGKKLEVNQLDKIKKESELLEELKSLRL